MYAVRHPDGGLAAREDLAAYSANMLEGYFRAVDPDGRLGLAGLLRNVWRGARRRTEHAPDETSRPVPPNPGPEAPPAASVPPAVSGEAAAPSVGEFEMVMRLEEIREAARPFAALARLRRQDAGYCVVANEFVDDTREYVEITTDDLRRLVRAAGLWTDEMQAPQPPEAPGPAAKPAEPDPPPPADRADDPVGEIDV